MYKVEVNKLMLNHPWLILFLAGFFEVFMTMMLKYSNGFSKLWPSIGFGIFAFLSFYTFSFALKEIPIGTAYAVWTSIGVIGTVIAAYFLFADEVTSFEALCFLLIVIGIAGLKYSGN